MNGDDGKTQHFPHSCIFFIAGECSLCAMCVLSDYNLENDDLSLEGLLGRGTTNIAYSESGAKHKETEKW